MVGHGLFIAMGPGVKRPKPPKSPPMGPFSLFYCTPLGLATLCRPQLSPCFTLHSALRQWHPISTLGLRTWCSGPVFSILMWGGFTETRACFWGCCDLRMVTPLRLPCSRSWRLCCVLFSPLAQCARPLRVSMPGPPKWGSIFSIQHIGSSFFLFQMNTNAWIPH